MRTLSSLLTLIFVCTTIGCGGGGGGDDGNNNNGPPNNNPPPPPPPPSIVVPLNAGKQWLYDLAWSLTCVGCGTGVTVEEFVGESILYVDREMDLNAAGAGSGWRIFRYEIESTPSVDNAFTVDIEYLSQTANGLFHWASGEWQQILSTQSNEFGDNSLLMTRNPNSSARTQQSIESVSVPSGTYTSVRAHSTYREGFTPNAPVDHDEDHSEYYADGVGLVRSVWDFWYDDNDPSAIDVYEVGAANLKAIDTGNFPAIRMELEPNDSPNAPQLLPAVYSIANGDVHILDSGTLINDGNVADNINGQPKLEDWYRFELTQAGSVRVDMVYDYVSNSNVNDLDVYLYREEPGGALTFIDRSTNPGLGMTDDPQEAIVTNVLPAGTYHVAVQAWDTPTENVDYWILIRD